MSLARALETLVRTALAHARRALVASVGTSGSGPATPAAVKIMGRLGLAWVMIIATVSAAFLSLLVAWLAGLLIAVPNYGVHMLLAFVIPFLVTPFLSYFMALSTRALQRAQVRAGQLTEAAEREREHLETAVNNMPIGLVMFDAGKRLIVGNERYREMYGLPRELMARGTHLRQMLEHRLDAGNFEGKDRQDYVERILKLVEQTDTTIRVVPLGDGRAVSIIHHPIAGGGWVGTHEDVTEREQLNARLEEQHQLVKLKEEQLQARNVQIDAALNNMVQGLAMFDADYRLVLCNKRYMDMYGFRPDQVEPGTTLLRIIEHRLANGLVADRSPQELVEAMLHRRDGTASEQFLSHLNDGRCIAIAVQPMANGGTVTTHQDITEQRRSEAKIAHMALHDALTGVPNRVLFNERLGHALTRVARGEVLAIHILDLDRFKAVNDTLGHGAGDKLLKLVAARLRSIVREVDTIARMGGDEFAILQDGIAQPADATALARRIIEALSEPYDVDGQQAIIGTSVGIAMGPGDGITPEELVRNADLALYRAKGEGRGCFHFFERGMDAQMQERRAIEYDLRKALGEGQFELHYQPVVALDDGEIQGFEALIRWHHPQRGMVLPGTFIPLAEEIGFIVPLGEWAIREACATAATWPDDLKIAVNLSPAQFRSSGLVQTVVSALAASGLAPERLELEVTETVLLEDGEATLDTLYQLRGLGVRVAMDDFGTGYSSLSYLQKFPFDKIKIDRSFVKDVAADASSLNIIRAVTAMAKGLGMTTTAEGVETHEQLDAVRSEGCTEMQGYLFSQPLPAGEIERLYLASRRHGGRDAAVTAA
jgi:diguanylate cyclase (GGDEF)-like protein/PAS domain S-box-containing protein